MLAMPVASRSQFLRLGPFDFDAKTRIEAIYTTNVEEERPSQSTAEREDIYFIWGFDLLASSELGPRTRLDIDTGIAIEKHVNRPDLDNSENPFGRLRIRAETDINRYKFYGMFTYLRESDSTDDVFVPGGKKRRQVSTTHEYEAGVDWEINNLQIGGSYLYNEERFDDSDFKEGDKYETTIDAYIRLKITEDVGVGYTYERKKTDFINAPAGLTDPGWEVTEKIFLDWRLPLFPRPEIIYTLGIEREDKDGEKGDWELTHTFTATDEVILSPTLRLSGFASYKIEQNPDEDDVEFTYGALLEHAISPRSVQTFSASRKPVATFGSTTDTDETKYVYTFKTIDLFIYDLSLLASVGYSINDPVVGPTEKKWEYDAVIAHTQPISPRVKRTIAYTYSLEDSNLEDELLEVHEVKLMFEYQF